MVIRACLVASDWNYSVDRKQKRGLNGELLYSLLYFPPKDFVPVQILKDHFFNVNVQSFCGEYVHLLGLAELPL